MIINIELRPEEELALLERARTSGRDLAGYVHQILHEHIHTPDPDIGRNEVDDEASFTVEDLIDHEAIASCTKEADEASLWSSPRRHLEDQGFHGPRRHRRGKSGTLLMPRNFWTQAPWSSTIT